MNFQNLLTNAKHWKTSVAGGLVLVATALHSTDVQALVAVDPHIATAVTVAGAVVGGLVLIFGAQDPAAK